MSDYICPYRCSYRTNSGFCGYTGGYEACQYRRIIGVDYEIKQLLVEPVKTAPAADVVTVRHGRWIKEIFNDGYGDYPLYVCSECRAQSARKRNFCYDCGAKMDGEA